MTEYRNRAAVGPGSYVEVGSNIKRQVFSGVTIFRSRLRGGHSSSHRLTVPVSYFGLQQGRRTRLDTTYKFAIVQKWRLHEIGPKEDEKSVFDVNYRRRRRVNKNRTDSGKKMENTATASSSSTPSHDDYQAAGQQTGPQVSTFRRPSVITNERRQSSLPDLDADLDHQKMSKAFRFRQLSERSPAKKVDFREESNFKKFWSF